MVVQHRVARKNFNCEMEVNNNSVKIKQRETLSHICCISSLPALKHILMRKQYVYNMN